MKLQQDHVPPEYAAHVLAEQYGCSPQEVRGWPIEDVTLAMELSEARAKERDRKRAQHR